MLDEHKGGRLEYLAEVRRLAVFNNFGVGLFKYKGDQLLFGGIQLLFKLPLPKVDLAI